MQIGNTKVPNIFLLLLAAVAAIVVNSLFFGYGPSYLGGHAEPIKMMVNGQEIEVKEAPTIGYTQAANGTWIQNQKVGKEGSETTYPVFKDGKLQELDEVPDGYEQNQFGIYAPKAGLGSGESTVTDVNAFPTNLNDLGTYIKGLPTATGKDFNAEYKPKVISDANSNSDIYIFREGDAKKLGTMVKEYGFEAVWSAIADVSDKDALPSAFRWEKSGKNPKIKVSEQVGKSLTLDLKHYEIDSTGDTQSITEGEILDTGKLYGADHQFD